MAYGIEILTTEGYQNTAGMRTVRFVASYSKTGSSGTQILNGYDSNNGSIFVRATDGKFPPVWDYNNTTKVFSWNNSNAGFGTASNHSTAFTITTLEIV